MRDRLQMVVRLPLDQSTCSGAVAERALWIFLLSPLAQIGFSLATPDAPLILGWAATIYFAQKAVFGGDSRWYYAAGIAAGFAVLAN